MARRLPPGIELRTAADGTRTYRIRWRQATDGRNLSHSFTRLGEATDAKARITAAGHVCHCPLHAPGSTSTRHYGAPLPPASPTADGGAVRGLRATPRPRPHRRRPRLPQTLRPGDGTALRAVHRHPARRHQRPGRAGLDRRHGERHPPVAAQGQVRPRRHRGELPCNLGCDAKRSATTIKRLLVQAGSVMASANKAKLATGNPFRGHRLGRRDRDQHTEMSSSPTTSGRSCKPASPKASPRPRHPARRHRPALGRGDRARRGRRRPVRPTAPPACGPRLAGRRRRRLPARPAQVAAVPAHRHLLQRRPRRPAAAHRRAREDDEFVFTVPEWPARPAQQLVQPRLAARPRPGQRAGHDQAAPHPRPAALHVSWLIAAGRPVPAISRRLGTSPSPRRSTATGTCSPTWTTTRSPRSSWPCRSAHQRQRSPAPDRPCRRGWRLPRETRCARSRSPRQHRQGVPVRGRLVEVHHQPEQAVDDGGRADGAARKAVVHDADASIREMQPLPSTCSSSSSQRRPG
jgi:hypothetical protein